MYDFFSPTSSLDIFAFSFWRVSMFLFSLLAVSKQKCLLQHFYYIWYRFVLFCFALFSSSLFWGGVLGFVLFRLRLTMYCTRHYSRFLYQHIHNLCLSKDEYQISLKPQLFHIAFHYLLIFHVYQPLCLEGPCLVLSCLPFPSVFFLWSKAVCWEIPMYVEITMELHDILHSH